MILYLQKRIVFSTTNFGNMQYIIFHSTLGDRNISMVFISPYTHVVKSHNTDHRSNRSKHESVIKHAQNIYGWTTTEVKSNIP